jgi:hypothetical protein
MNFGKWIVVSFILFGAFIATLVTVCVRQDISLVTKNYYEEEIRHQQKIDRMNNARALPVQPEITLHPDRITVTFADFARVEGGELKLLRPSNIRLDHTFAVGGSQSQVQEFPLRRSDPGLYRASLRWSMNGKEYLIEKVIVL